MPKNQIIIATAKNGFRVKYYASNGEVLAVSEVLNSKQAAEKNIKAMRKLLQYERLKAE